MMATEAPAAERPPTPTPRERPPTPTLRLDDESIISSLRKLFDSIRRALFILGTALIVFVCASNTITWYVQRFWGASGDFWQSRYADIYHFFGGNPFYMFMIGTAVITNTVFWSLNGLLMVLDVTGWPQWLLRYKVQEDKNVPVDKAKLKKALIQVIFNQTVVALPVTLVAYYIMQWRGCDFGLQMPTFQRLLVELVIFSLIEEICFYYGHRLFHHPLLYRHIHKRHHEWTAPVGITSIYAHPVEHVVSNLGPPLLGPIVMGAHVASAWLWFSVALFSTTVAHCGYHFPFLPSPEAHDFHHLKFNNNFGVLGVLDRLHGTDENFRKSKAYERHFLLLSRMPVRQQFPDDPKPGACRAPKEE